MALNAAAEEAEARRERQDRLSRTMGGLLLRGYRMLGSCCPRCGTILLQDKEQRLLCVTCQDSQGTGRGTALAGGSGIGGIWGNLGKGRAGNGMGELLLTLPAPLPPPRPSTASGSCRQGAPRPPEPLSSGRGQWGCSVAVLAKLGWAARELPRTGSAEGSAQLCALVSACASALRGLQGLDPPRGAPSTPLNPESPP
ncbi:protein ZNRD2 [Myiozetetes cayanensis]|uniref:protein ZNRD2 n=1 Tax=Myiozetetes cayanensis TaxID=478635 RepID=UPI00215E9C3D|nr:protein ZNRD2 [Myiozetetes cayanensis]